MNSPKSNMLTRFKKKFLPKSRKYDMVNGSDEGQPEVHLSRCDRSKSGSLSSTGSPKHGSNGMIIWQNNTYDLLPFQLETISPKPSLRHNSLPSKRQGGEELPPLPIKARDAENGKKSSPCDNCGLLPGAKTPSPTDTYVTPIMRNSTEELEIQRQSPLIKQPQSICQGDEAFEKLKPKLEEGKDETDNHCMKVPPPPNFRDSIISTQTIDIENSTESDNTDKVADEDDKEYPDTWLRSPRDKSPLPSVSTPSPTDSEKTCTDASLTSDSNTEKKPSLKKREKSAPGVRPPMMRPLRKKKAAHGGDSNGDRKSVSKEDSPLPPSPPSELTSKNDKACSLGPAQKMLNEAVKKELEAKLSNKSDDGGGYTSLDELQEQLKKSSTLPAKIGNGVKDDIDSVDSSGNNEDLPFPPPPPPLKEALESMNTSTPKTFIVEEGQTMKQTIVRPRYRDGLLHCDGYSDMSDMDTSGRERGAFGDAIDFNQNVHRNISHESGYETSGGIDHSSSYEHIRDDVFNDPVKDLLSENIDYGDDEDDTKQKVKKPFKPKTHAKEMYALPKTGLPRSHSNQSDTSTDNYPESPDNTGTSNSVSSPEDDGDRDTLKMSSEVLLPLNVSKEKNDSDSDDGKYEDEDKDDYLPPIPSRNYRKLSNESQTKVNSEVTESDANMISSIHSDFSTDGYCDEPVHMSLDEVREQAKTLGVPLASSSSSVNQSQPCISSKPRTFSESSNDPASPSHSATSKRNTFPIDKSSTPTNTPTKKSNKKKAKIRIPTIFSRNSAKNSPEHVINSKCDIHGTESIQRRSLPPPPPAASMDDETDDDKTPHASPAHHKSSSVCLVHGPTSTPTSPANTLGGYRDKSYGKHARSGSDRMTRSLHSPAPGYASRTLSGVSGCESPGSTLSMGSLARSSHASLASSVNSVNSGLSSSGYATNSTSTYTTSNADFIGSLQKLKHVGWYWGPLGWDDAESKLSNKPDGSFLVRDSSDDRYILSLSFRSQATTHHTRIEHYKGMFSFYSQPKSHGATTIIEFIDKAMEHSRSGKFLYFLRPRAPGLPPAPVQLLYPISRFKTMPSLQHVCRFEIIKHVRKDHIDALPVPQKVKDYLLQSQYYIEYVEEE